MRRNPGLEQEIKDRPSRPPEVKRKAKKDSPPYSPPDSERAREDQREFFRERKSQFKASLIAPIPLPADRDGPYDSFG